MAHNDVWDATAVSSSHLFGAEVGMDVDHSSRAVPRPLPDLWLVPWKSWAHACAAAVATACDMV